MAARRGHDAVKGSSVGQLKHAALLRRVCKMNEQHPISWDFNWQQEVFDDKQGDLRKENLTSLLHRMDKVKQEVGWFGAWVWRWARLAWSTMLRAT